MFSQRFAHIVAKNHQDSWIMIWRKLMKPVFRHLSEFKFSNSFNDHRPSRSTSWALVCVQAAVPTKAAPLGGKAVEKLWETYGKSMGNGYFGWWVVTGTWILFFHTLGIVIIDFRFFRGVETTNQYFDDIWEDRMYMGWFLVGIWMAHMGNGWGLNHPR